MKVKNKTGLALRVQRSAAPPRGKAFLSALLPAALLALGLAQTAASVFPSGVGNGWAGAAILFAFSLVLLALAQTKAAPWMLAAGVLVLGVVGATRLPKRLWKRLEPHPVSAALGPVLTGLLLLAATAALVDGSFNPFLYFRF